METIETEDGQQLCWRETKDFLLGRGSYGEVYKGNWIVMNGNGAAVTEVAVKKVKPDKIKYEIGILKEIIHPNILKYHFDIGCGFNRYEIFISKLQHIN